MDHQHEHKAILNVADAKCVYGGVTYVIGVHQKADGLRASWACQDCQGQGSLPTPEQDADLAIRRCLQLVKQHHAVKHLRGRQWHQQPARIN